jgi:hypothetical protein
MNFPSIDIQGSILSTDLLAKIRNEQANFQQGKDFHPDLTNAKLKDEISLAWQEARGQWTIYKSKLARLKEGETGTTETRNFWILPLLTNLGYNLTFDRKGEGLNGKSFPIGYRDSSLDNFPIYVGGYHESLDKRPENKQLRVSPHAMMQEYLNYSEHLYGIVTNGRQLRLLRDASRITRLSYVEFNLEKMMEEDLYSDFVILYRLLHASRMPKRIDGGAESIIEKYHQEGLEAGSTIRSKLGDAVKEAIRNLANGFINHPNNTALREAVTSGNFSADEYYHHQLRIIYRLLFLFVIEERNLVYADNKTPEAKRFHQIYFNYYSLLRLRKLAKKLLPPEADRHYDLWLGLISTFSLFEKKEIGEKLGIMAFQGDLFGYHAISGNGYDLHQCYLSNAVLLNIIKSLCYFENENGVLTAVNYGGLDVEEFGSVYEGLLELKLEVKKIEGSNQFSCSFDTSNERGKSGSHYTPEELVQPLIKHSLEYLIEDRIKEKVSSEWSVVSGKYPAIATQLKNLIINLSFEYEKLSGLGSLEKWNGFSSADLPINQLLSQRRIVWNDFATPEVGKFYSGKHSRGLGTKHQQGIQPLLEHGRRQPEGNGNPSDTGSKNKSLQTGTNQSHTGAFNSFEQANTFLATLHLSQKQLAQIWNNLPLAIRQALFTTQHLLNLKIADVACGSGHILLSAARRLSLEIARVQTGEEQPNPVAIRKAMKEVVRNCIYGVDKNPLAVELCKIALWLEAYNPGEPLNFLDHHIKCGDAIVGLAHRSELENGIANEAFKPLPGDDAAIAKTWRDKNVKERKEREAKALQLKVEFEKNTENSVQEAMAEYKTFSQLPETTPEEIERKAKAYKKFIDGKGFTFLKAMADTQVAQFFIPKTEANKDYLMTDADFRLILSGYKGWQDRKVAKATAIAQEKRFFHWFIEFPEVFNEGGFDCVLGNPPYLGGSKISGDFGDFYYSYLRNAFPSTKGICDLAAFFLLRNHILIKIEGFISLITTNSISQGDTRESALEYILNFGGKINYAVKSKPWPGIANLNVSIFSYSKDLNRKLIITLENKEVESISSYFDSDQGFSKPFALRFNTDLSFDGTKIYGEGFLLTKQELDDLLKENEDYREVIFEYLGGEDLNDSPEALPSRWVINFFDWSFDKASSYKKPFQIILNKVKPYRDTVKREKTKKLFWQYEERRVRLYERISEVQSFFVATKTSKFLCFTRQNSGKVFSSALVIITNPKFSFFAQIQSTLHLSWVEKNSSTLETRLRYTGTDSFETFPFPSKTNSIQEKFLETIGESYHEHRRKLMLGMQLGLTKTYNLFHDPAVNGEWLIASSESQMANGDKVNSESQMANGDKVNSEWRVANSDQLTTDHSPLATRHSPLPTDHSPLATRHSPLPTDHSPLTTHHSLLTKSKNLEALKKHLEKTPNTISFNEAIQGILKLRELHVQMDEAVLDAYGWNDIQLRHDFYEVDYLPENDRIRFTIHPDARKEVLKRLLELNHKIHEEEVKAGLWDKKKNTAKKKKSKSSSSELNEPQTGYGVDLFNQE